MRRHRYCVVLCAWLGMVAWAADTSGGFRNRAIKERVFFRMLSPLYKAGLWEQIHFGLRVFGRLAGRCLVSVCVGSALPPPARAGPHRGWGTKHPFSVPKRGGGGQAPAFGRPGHGTL
jgi:hypothetical protein